MLVPSALKSHNELKYQTDQTDQTDQIDEIYAIPARAHYWQIFKCEPDAEIGQKRGIFQRSPIDSSNRIWYSL